MALYHLLVEAKDHFDFSLLLLHVDHGWRKESQQEAEALQALPFPLCVAKLNLEGNNLEEKSRDARYAFFTEMAKKYDFSTVLLAHHQDDLAETVLKRVLEGANLDKQGGMTSVSLMDGLTLWRPLLTCTKTALKKYLGERDHFTDPTNESDRFLRGRMRNTILPQLEGVFGKNIGSALAIHAHHATTLDVYLERKTVKYWENYDNEVLNLERLLPIEPIEFSFFLRKLYLSIPSDVIDNLLEIILEKSSGKRVVFSGGEIRYERGRVETNFTASDRLAPLDE